MIDEKKKKGEEAFPNSHFLLRHCALITASNVVDISTSPIAQCAQGAKYTL